jgi:hypothetical protein
VPVSVPDPPLKPVGTEGDLNAAARGDRAQRAIAKPAGTSPAAFDGLLASHVRPTCSAVTGGPPPGDRLLVGAFGTRHLRAGGPATSGAYGEGPAWRMGVTFGISIV